MERKKNVIIVNWNPFSDETLFRLTDFPHVSRRLATEKSTKKINTHTYTENTHFCVYLYRKGERLKYCDRPSEERRKSVKTAVRILKLISILI